MAASSLFNLRLALVVVLTALCQYGVIGIPKPDMAEELNYNKISLYPIKKVISSVDPTMLNVNLLRRKRSPGQEERAVEDLKKERDAESKIETVSPGMLRKKRSSSNIRKILSVEDDSEEGDRSSVETNLLANRRRRKGCRCCCGKKK